MVRILETLSVTAALFNGAAATTCEALCLGVASCANNPQAQGSYCKDSQTPQVCFGLYYTDATQTTICFEPNDPTCPETIPVTCPTTPPPPTNCQALCDSLPSCANDPQAHGSYCKTWENPSSCFGTRHKYVHYIFSFRSIFHRCDINKRLL
jgi:hypothetical protein